MNLIKASMDYENALLAGNHAKAKNGLHMASISNANEDYIQRIVGLSLENIGGKWENGEVTGEQVYLSAMTAEENIREFLPAFAPANRKNRIAFAWMEETPVREARIVPVILEAYGYGVLEYPHGMTPWDVAGQAIKDGVKAVIVSIRNFSTINCVVGVVGELKKNGSKIKVVAEGPPFRMDCRLWKNVGADAQVNIHRAVQLIQELL